MKLEKILATSPAPVEPYLVRIPGQYDPGEASARAGLCCSPDEGLTQQHHKDECDVNVLMARYLAGQEQPRKPMYGDFTRVGEFHELQNKIALAKSIFMSYPPDLRARFDNDAGNLFNWLADPSHAQEAVELGLMPEAPTDRAPGSSAGDRGTPVDPSAAGGSPAGGSPPPAGS